MSRGAGSFPRIADVRTRRRVQDDINQKILIPEATMTPRTIYLSCLLGLSLMILAVAEIVQRSILAHTALAIVGSPPLLLVCGVLTLVAGVTIVVGHNVWRGGLMPVVVTILGWLLLFKGA